MIFEDLSWSLMDYNSCCSSPLPWLWVIEMLTFANEIDASLLLDLVTKTPEISDNTCRNARELVSLRILESIYDDGASANSIPASIPGVRLDPSERCEDVLGRILPKTSNLKTAGAEMLPWDVKSFIAHKRSTLAAKCSLQQLKELILIGCNSPLASLREKSGLTIGNQPELPMDNGYCNDSRREGSSTNNQICAANDGSIFHRALSNENLSTLKRKRSGPTENAETESCNDQILLEDGCDTHIKTVKKYKPDIICGEQDLYRDLASVDVDRQTAGESKVMVSRDDEGCSFVKNHLGGMGRGPPMVEVLLHEKQVLQYDTGVQNDKSDEPKAPCERKEGSNISENDGNGGDEVLPCEKHFSHQQIELPDKRCDEEQEQGDDAKDNEEDFHELRTANEDTEKVEDSIPRNFSTIGEADKEVECSNDNDWYNEERKDITMKKNDFLNSQCTFSQDSLAIDYRELNLCTRCKMGENLLVCSSKSCPIVIHESCLGCEASFDMNGKFYCPFCAYFCEISRYREAKKKATFARTNLSTFISLGDRKEKTEQLPGSCGVKQHPVHDNVHTSGALNDKNIGKNVGDCELGRKLDHDQTRVSLSGASDNPSCGEKEVDLANMAPRNLNKDKGKRKGKERGKFSPSPKANKPRELAATGMRKSQRKSSSKQVHENPEVHAGRSEERNLCHQSSDLSCGSGDEEEISEDEIENSGASKYFMRVKKEKNFTYPPLPQLRRTKLPWTTAEEEMLKDGVQKLCGPHDKFYPWKRILEFGAGTFHESRTTIDLKDKWRNMCKASPKKKWDTKKVSMDMTQG